MIESDVPPADVAGSTQNGPGAGLWGGHIRMDEAEASRAARDLWGFDGRAARVDTEKDDTFVITDQAGTSRVLKVTNPAEDLSEVDFEVGLLHHVGGSAHRVPVPRVFPSRAGELLAPITDDAGQARHARLMSYLAGTPLDSTDSSPAEREQVGAVLARLRHATADYSHPAQSRLVAWDVQHLTQLAPLLDTVADPGRRELLAEGLSRFARVVPTLAGLRRQVLHNDFSRSNLVVDHEAPEFVVGVIDFGDAVHTAIAVDVSTALVNQLPRTIQEHPDDVAELADLDLFADGRDLLRGYLREADLLPTELAAIPYLVMGRVIARALITLRRAALMPANARYILRDTEPGWGQLRWLLAQDDDRLETALTTRTSAPSRRGTMNNGFDPDAAADLPTRTRELIERRARSLGPAYRLFYREPVQIVRGSGTTLWDADGAAYLDAYNNVQSVGHAHPRVVAAIHEQLQTLNTNTRYLHEAILDYADDLRATLDGPLADGHLMFTCTGSEANDLALRIAKHRTGRRGVIITSEAYHGNSAVTAGISPSLGEGSPLGTWVRRVPSPDSYRNDPATLASDFAGWVRQQIDDLQRHGDGLAAFICDSVFSSDGIFTQPTDLLAPVARVVREAGGLFIADEVQSGFARTGEHLWGHRRHGLDPDIVTLGKPMGNGFPVAGVLVTDDAVAPFGRDQRYFNTFGGNTVAVAAAQATLDVIRDEDVLGNVSRIGHRVVAGLNELATRYDAIGDVRGAGLYLGVEIVSDRAAKTPDAASTTAIVNGLRQRRVLISATGPHGNVLKIRPPLVFSSADADRLLETLDEVIRSLTPA